MLPNTTYNYKNDPQQTKLFSITIAPNLSLIFSPILVFENQTMENQANQFDNDEVNFVVPILAESIAPRWAFVFHRFGNSTGNLFSFDVSGSLGSVMGRVKILYQGFLPKSTLGRFFSKVVVERGTINRVRMSYIYKHHHIKGNIRITN